MSVLSRKTVRDELAAALQSAISGAGKPVSSVYGYQPGKLDKESPVVLVLSRGIRRSVDGIGAHRYRNEIALELHILVYDGAQNPLNEQQREDKLDSIEAALAAWFVDHQSGTSYQNAWYAPEMTDVRPVIYVDGNPYLLEIVRVTVDAKDS